MAYSVKCDECKVEIRKTESLRESAEGGLCQDCDINLGPEEVAAWNEFAAVAAR